jgi:hypothetical protein
MQIISKPLECCVPNTLFVQFVKEDIVGAFFKIKEDAYCIFFVV